MSDNILPFEMQAEILKRLPIKSLIQFKSVSKQWKYLIDSPMFIHDHTIANHNQPHQYHRLLVRYKLNSEQKYISIIDNNDNDNDSDSFPQQRFSVTAPRKLSLLRQTFVLGSSRGLLCFYGLTGEPGYFMAVLWNPSIRKCVGIVIPNALYGPGYTVIGFGVCPNTSDPKLVKVNHHVVSSLSESEAVTWEVDIFTLSSGDWRSISIKLPCSPIYLSSGQVVKDGVIYWIAYNKHPYLDKLRHNRIISFDLTSEEFGEVFLSDHLLTTPNRLVVSKLTGSLVVLEHCREEGEPVCVVWKLEHSVPKSFKKLFTVKAPDNAMVIRVLSFFKNGEPIMSTVDDYGQTDLYAYEHNSGRFKGLWIFPSGNGDRVTSCSVTSYRETLLLLDKPNAIIH